MKNTNFTDEIQNFQDTIFIWIRIYREIFKSALVYL